MTPLAARIVKELTLPVKERTLNDRVGLLRFMSDVHCFEVSEVLDLATALRDQFSEQETDGLKVFSGLAFLPAPRTWIEWRQDGGRVGVLLVAEGEHRAKFRFACDIGDLFSSEPGGSLPLDGSEKLGKSIFISEYAHPDLHSMGMNFGWGLYAFLSMINEPGRINQRVEQPHRELQRRIASKFGGVGRYPLHASRTLTLKVPRTFDASNEREWQDYLSNRMPLHFVRAHRRRSAGVHDARYDPKDYRTWDLIPAQWRGDPALGIKLTDYALKAA